MRTLWIPILATVVGGCRNDTAPTGSDDLLFFTVARATAGVGAYSSVGTDGLAMHWTNFQITRSATEACEYQAESAFFVCPSVTRSGITMSRSYQLLNAAGTPMSVRDPLAVVSVRAATDWDGVTGGSDPILIRRHEDAAVSGVLRGPRTINGTSTTHVSWLSDGSAVAFDDTSSTTNLVIPETSNEFPSGVIESRHVVTFTDAADGIPMVFATSEVLTFNGTGSVIATTTNGTTTRTCTIHFVSRSRSCN